MLSISMDSHNAKLFFVPHRLRADNSAAMTAAHTPKDRPPRFLLAMPDELRSALEREAFVANRTLTAEINMRLRASFTPKPTTYTTPHAPTVLPTNDNGPAGALSDTDQAILEVFRALSVEKRLALLALLR